MTRTFEAAPRIRAIDTQMCGHDLVTSAYLVEANEPALVETGPTTSVDAVLAGLDELGVDRGDVRHVVVTHIHLDHAGGAGALLPHLPNATVWVHERGAPHLAQPARLMESATRIYGRERLLSMFGEVHPIPENRVRAMGDGDRVDLGGRGLEVLYTPGHASHHVCLFDDETGGVFVGDALGVFLPDVRILRPATPPPEFDLEQAVASIERVAERKPSRILFSHFGPAPEVEHLCALAISRLRKWTRLVEEAMTDSDDVDVVVDRLRDATSTETNAALDERRDALEGRYEILSSYAMNAQGLMRYIHKSRERGTRSAG